eukprot:8058398-Pyramimonas_sp.AAC.1
MEEWEMEEGPLHLSSSSFVFSLQASFCLLVAGLLLPPRYEPPSASSLRTSLCLLLILSLLFEVPPLADAVRP